MVLEDENHSNSNGNGDEINNELNNNINNNNSYGETPSSPVIDVKQSELEFKKMAAHLEGESEHLRMEEGRHDLEGRAVQDENDEDFKLRKYFEDSQRMSMDNGGKPKKMGVSVRNLTVVGKGADVSVISTMLTPLKYLFNPFNWVRNDGTTFDILHNVNTFCKDGEMLLVLGRPGAGCSTLLRVISNQRNTYVDVKGDVNYGGIAAKDWERYKGEAIYTPEEDTHHPTLTLKQTLDFALKCKTPGQRLPDETKRTFRTKMYNLLVNMFGISAQANTMVGNEFIRGLSGGERKRMTITEAMVSASSITCWDCSTRGLDAASALDYAKSLRIMSDTLHKTTIASFYQASDSIYNLFDKVLVLEKGRCIYFGPIHDAKNYFLNLGFDCEPRKSTPDFLTGVTNPQERKIRPGCETTAPETSADFEAAWLRSPQYQYAIEEQTAFEKQIQVEQPYVQFVEQVRAEKSRTTPKNRPYTTSFFTQVRALTIRHGQLIWGNKFNLYSRYFSLLIQSFVYGSTFFLQPVDLPGMFTRGGAIFGSLVFNSFISQGEVALTFMGRRVLQKQKSYAMYRPSAYHIAQIVTDMPIVFLQVTIYSIISYFMFGFQYRAEQFFIFYFTMVGIVLCITNMFRAFGNYTPSLYISQNIMSVFLLFMLTYAGYTIPYDKMHPWFQWFYWINPFAYAFKALMANEFKDLEFDCAETAIPYGPPYANFSANRVCAGSGAISGNLFVRGEDYLDVGLNIKVSQRALNVIVVYLFWLLFTALNIIALELIDWTSGGYTQKVFKPGKAPKMNDAEDERIQNRIVQEATSKMKETLKMRGGIFTWQHINYTVPVPGGTRLLLDDVEGWIKPHTMCCLMGSSGAGKTTLLDVLAKRKTIGVVTGDTFLNGKPLGIDFERITGYVEQMDVHNANLTIREALRFSAKMRQEPSIPLQEKFDYVEQVLEMMEMKHLGDALIGDLERGIGISVEERKRLTIGMELVAKPHIMFLDEPTSGLDAQSSYNIIKFIRKLADSGMPLICTIHQPSSVLFEHFDRILLLAKGGKTVYFGDIGDKSHTLTSYFEKQGVRPCTESENPAEYILEAIGAGVHGKTDKDWPALWKQSPECAAVASELSLIKSNSDSLAKSSDNLNNSVVGADGEEGPAREFATPLWYQFIEVYKRLNVIYWRDPYYSFGRFFMATVVGLIIGFSFFNLKDSSSDMNQRIFIIFQSIILGIMMIFLSLPQLFTQREYFRRDYASKCYSWQPFSVGMVLVELPYLVVTASLFFFTVYWTAGLDFDADSGFYFWINFVLYLFFCVSFGQAVGAICANMFIAKFIIPLLILFLFLFCGVMVPPDSMPSFWRNWAYHLVPTRYLLEGIVTNVLKNVKVHCSSEDLIKFDPPAGQTCGQYTQIFSTYSTGYIDNPSATSQCGYCIYSNGAEYYHGLGWSEDNRWRNFGILICYWIFNIFMVNVFVYISRKPRR